MTPRSKHPLFWMTVLAVPALAVLLALGTWQMQRKAWKDGLIAQIEARTVAAPMPLAEALLRVQAGEDLEYTRVRAEGRFVSGAERHYWAPGPKGNGWHIYAPFELSVGEVSAGGSLVVIVNRGFVPDHLREPSLRPEPGLGGATSLVGLLRKPEAKGAFTPENDAARNLWYWRDLQGMARSLGLGSDRRLAPFFLDAEAGARPPAPEGGVTRLSLPNTHFQYAMTWYGLAGTLIGVYLAFAWPFLRRARPRPPNGA